MDRLFLDANILFSAAYRADAGLLQLWKLEDVALVSSAYAIAEARINLTETAQRKRLARLVRRLEIIDPTLRELPPGIGLPEKDAPILLAAMASRATHLITGDLRHFGRYFGKSVDGVLIVSPSEYLRNRPS